MKGDARDDVRRLEDALAALLERADDQSTAELLARHEHLRDLLEPLAARVADEAVAPAEQEGLPFTQLADFRLVRRLGQGSMGEVFEARQLSLDRPVALKILSPRRSFDPRSLTRFRREAAAGGRIQHPGIVVVHSVGEHDGVHYIAQEIVGDGRTLADRIEAQRRDPGLDDSGYRDIAELIAEVAEALAAAHEAGVIHRDVKPANILIDATGRPRVADFGLARLQDVASLSETGDLAGSLPYMSPEQTSGRPASIDARTDVFSLGATLYEALTHRRAFEGDSTQQLLERIRTEDPVEPRRIRARVPADLATICLKALEKEPRHRYATMAVFAADLRRFLAHEPVVARPPTTWVRSVKWFRRHPVVSSSGSVLLLALVVLTLMLLRLSSAKDETEDALSEKTSALGRERSARRDAESARARAEEAETLSILDARRARELMDFVKRSFSLAGPAVGRGEEFTISEVLDFATGDLVSSPRLDRRLRGELLTFFASIHADLGLIDRAANLAEMVVALRTDPMFPSSPFVVEAIGVLARARRNQGRLADAEAALDLVPATLQLPSEDMADEVLLLVAERADLKRERGLYRESEDTIRRILDIWRSRHGDADPHTLQLQGRLGLDLMDLGRLDEALLLQESALESAMATLGPDALVTMRLRTWLSGLLVERGGVERAVTLLEEGLRHKRSVLGDEHPATIWSVANLADALQNADRPAEALALCDDWLERAPDDDGWWHLLLREARANALMALDKVAEGLVETRFVAEESVRVLGEHDHETLHRQINLAKALWKAGHLADAENLLKTLSAVQDETLDAVTPQALEARTVLASVLLAEGRLEDSLKLAAQTLELQLDLLGESHPDTLNTRNVVAWVLSRTGAHDEAEAMIRAGVAASQESLGAAHSKTLGAEGNLASALSARGRFDEARDLYRSLLERMERHLGPDSRDTRRVRRNYCNMLERWGEQQREAGRFDDAIEASEEALAIARRLGDNQRTIVVNLSDLGGALLDAGRAADAVRTLADALDMARAADLLAPVDLAVITQHLGAALHAQEQHVQARDQFHESLCLRLEEQDRDHPDVLYILYCLAASEATAGNRDAATAGVRELLDLAPAGSQVHGLAEDLLELILQAKPPTEDTGES